jgi:tetratricopeptide (TPR) repeat protein
VTRPPASTRKAAGAARLLDAAAAHFHAGRVAEAAEAYARAERADPADFRAPFSLATLDLQQGRPDRAAPRLRRVVRLKPDLFEAWHNLAAACQALELWDEAASAYARALALRPAAIETRRNLAAALAVLGRADEAAEHYRALAQVPPLRLWALSRLAYFRPAAIDDDALADMRRAADDAATDVDIRIGLEFGLGEVLEQRGRDAEAFAAFAAGNRLKRAQLVAAGGPGGGPEAILRAHQRAAARVVETFTPALIAAHAGQGHPSAAPIFIVGMPRSGSTLLDQILGRHPDVAALGETAVLPPLLERDIFADPARPPDLGGLARQYLKAIRARGWSGAGRFVDKTLENFLHVGAIALMFPNATILHAVRDPVDTCLSCYRQLFATGAETLYDLTEIGAEYALYRRLMDHWRLVLPGRVIDVDHEALVADPERQIRWLVTEACGLAWNDACLTFHQAAGPVRTASAAQVRQPIFTTSLGRWRRYEAQLGPLLAALGADAPPSGS